MTSVKKFKKGDIITPSGGPFYNNGPGGTYSVSYKVSPCNYGLFCNLRIHQSFIKPYVRNISFKDVSASSYLGESMISKDKEENLKNAFAVIGALFIALIIYVYIMEFKNLQ
jgi:hypothetical protein